MRKVKMYELDDMPKKIKNLASNLTDIRFIAIEFEVQPKGTDELSDWFLKNGAKSKEWVYIYIS